MLLRQSQQLWRWQHRGIHRATSASCGRFDGTAAAPITARSISLYYDVPPRLQNNVSTRYIAKQTQNNKGRFIYEAPNITRIY